MNSGLFIMGKHGLLLMLTKLIAMPFFNLMSSEKRAPHLTALLVGLRLVRMKLLL